MHTENQLPEESQQLLILEDTRSDGEFKDLKNALVDMYEGSLSNETLNCTAISRHNNFYYFKAMFNLFSRLHAVERPEDKDNFLI
jgi:hypothetical protein